VGTRSNDDDGRNYYGGLGKYRGVGIERRATVVSNETTVMMMTTGR